MKIHVFLLILLSVAGPLTADSAADWVRELRIFSLTAGYPAVAEYKSGTDNISELIEGLPKRDFKPWTAALRPAGFIRTEAGTVAVVNGGYPILFTGGSGSGFTEPSRSAAEAYLESSRGLTVGTLFVDGDGAAGIHLYRDRFFNSGSSAQTGEGSPAIRLMMEADGDFELEIPSCEFAEANPEWEPVELIRKDGRNLISWKYSDEKKTRFRYLIHEDDGNAVDEIDAGFFRDEYNIRDIGAGPFALRGFERAVREGAAGALPADSGDIYLRLTTAGPADGDVPEAWLASAGRRGRTGLPAEFPACSSGSGEASALWYILGGTEVYVCGAGLSVLPLPALPPGFVWTDIHVEDGEMLLCFEEQRFPFTGRSGMILIGMRDILD